MGAAYLIAKGISSTFGRALPARTHRLSGPRAHAAEQAERGFASISGIDTCRTVSSSLYDQRAGLYQLWTAGKGFTFFIGDGLHAQHDLVKGRAR